MIKCKVQIFLISLIVLLVCGSIFVNAESVESTENTKVVGLLGDADADGGINVKDATTIQKKSASLIELDDVKMLLADVDENGSVNVKDATAIQKWVAGISVSMNINKVIYSQGEENPDESVYHSITYKNLNGAPAPEIVEYDESKGLSELPKLSVEGYEFKGWYTSEQFTQEITSIPVNCKEDYVLWARWEVIEYTITYNCGAGTNSEFNVTTYTVDDKVILRDASLKGYSFEGWLDETGKKIEGSVIPKGSTGDITLTAEWKTTRSLAHPIETLENPLFEPVMMFHEGDEYSYAFYLGYIENVPFGWQKPYYHQGNVNYTETHSTSTMNATSIAQTFDRVTEDSHAWQSDISISNEAEFKCPFVVSDKLTLAVSHTQSGANTITVTDGKTTTVTEETVVSSAESANITPGDSPIGWYRYVNYATVDVFATITYNISEDKYYIGNFNSIRDITTGWDYSAKSAAFDDVTDSDLPFELPENVYKYFDSLVDTVEDVVIKPSNGTCTVARYRGDDTNVIIPSYYRNTDGEILKVVGISSDAFSGNTSVTSVTMGEYITEIPEEAFYGCTSLETVVFNGKIATIGEKAFSGCSKLEISLPESLTVLGDNAFEGCEKLDEIVIPASIEMGAQIFKNCGELQIFAAPDKKEQLSAVLDSGATHIELSLAGFGKNDDAIDIGLLELSDNIKKFSLTGVYGQRYRMSLVSNAEQMFINDVVMDSECLINTGRLTLSETTIEGPLKFNGSQLLLQGTVDIGTLDSDSEMLTVSSTEGNMAELDVSGGIDVSGDLLISGVLDVNVQGANGRIGIEVNNLTLDVIGDFSVTGFDGSYDLNGGTAISANVVNLKVNGAVTVQGGNGFDATTYGGHGSDGGTAIIVDKLTIDVTEEISIIGGDGGNGYIGSTGDTGSPGPRRDWPGGEAGDGGPGGPGGTGGNGGAGGAAVVANKMIVVNGTVVCYGGDGGDGGKGGTGGTGGHGGCSNTWFTIGGDGGTGGTGGTGGNGRYGSIAINCSDVTGVYTQNNGANGKVGDAGDPGAGGEPGYYDGAGPDSGVARKGAWGLQGAPGAPGSIV